jgi:dTMP kinase
MGIFITFEGSEGVGKTTIIEKLKEVLAEKGYSVYVSREPGGDPIAEKIRNLLLAKTDYNVSSSTEALLFAASRSSHIDNVLIPKLQEFEIVICDRYIDSSIAYQGFGRNLGVEFIKKINCYADKLVPDITFFIDLDIIEGLKRTKTRMKMDRLDLEDINFYKKVREGYQYLLETEKRFVRIDASKNISETIDTIVDKITNALR